MNNAQIKRAALILISLIIFAAAVLSGGCSGGGNGSGNGSGSLDNVPADTIVLAVREDRTSAGAQQKLEECIGQYIDAFREEHPETKVRVIYYPELPKELSGIDCMLLGADDMLLYAEKSLEDVEKYIDEAGFSLSDIAGGAVNTARIFDGEPVRMIPFNYDHAVVLGDRELFNAAGVEIPGADWTLEDLETVSEALTERRDKVSYAGIYMPYYMNYSWQYFCNLLAGTYLTGGRFDFGTEGAVNDAVRRMYALYANNSAYSPKLSTTLRTCVMSLTYASQPDRNNLSFETEKNLARNPGKRAGELAASGNLVLLPLPSASDGTRTGVANTDFIKGFAVNSASGKKAAAGKFASFCLTEKGQRILNSYFGGIPSNRNFWAADFWRTGVFQGGNGDNALIGIDQGRRDDFTAALKGGNDVYNKNIRMRTVFSAVMVREFGGKKGIDKFIDHLEIFALDANKVIDGKAVIYSREGVS